MTPLVTGTTAAPALTTSTDLECLTEETDLSASQTLKLSTQA